MVLGINFKIKNNWLYIVCYFTSIYLFSQEKREVESSILTDNTPSIYSNYFLEFKINDNWNLKLENHTYSFKKHTLYEFPLLFKYKFKDKVSLLLGPKLDLLKNNTSGRYTDVYLYSSLGVEKEVLKNISIQGLYNYRVKGESPPSEFYSSGSRNSVKVTSKIKF